MAKTQTRRSISVRGELYDQIHDYCEKHNISMSSFVENRISSFLNGSRMDEQPPLPVTEEDSEAIAAPAPVKVAEAPRASEHPSMDAAKLAEEIRQHFTF